VSELIFLGLDGEMTGSGSPLDYQLIQIGVALMNGERFVSDIGFDTWNQTQEAMEVNKFTDERIRAGPAQWGVDRALFDFLEGSGAQPRRVVPIGWNVGSFDMPFVRQYLPRSAALFSYRTIDLNAVAFTVAAALGEDWKNLKKQAQKYADDHLGSLGTQRHDAGYDAAAAVWEWRWLMAKIRAGAEGEP
jgi:hypothetical protein